MADNYFLIDGSALLSQIRQLQRAHQTFRERKLCPKSFVAYFMKTLEVLHGGSYKRAIFYFPNGDEGNVANYLVMPDRGRPAEVRDLYFKFCGQKLKKSKEFNDFVETSVPPKFQDRFNKSEKGIDIEICCDAFKLATAARVDRIFLLTNDDDFVPFCRTIKEFGANISLIHLSEIVTRNRSLLDEVDSYDVISMEALEELFLVDALPKQEEASVEGGLAQPSLLKTDPSKSDPLDVRQESVPVSPAAMQMGGQVNDAPKGGEKIKGHDEEEEKK